MTLAEVEPGLWVCSEAALPAALADARVCATHLVSVGYPPPEDPSPDRALEGILRVELEDDEDGDLLTQIPDATAFIADGLRLRRERLDSRPSDPRPSCPTSAQIHCL